MTTPPDRPDAAPVAETARIDAIDVLRGFALLGILVMNIQAFAMPQAAYFNPTAYGDLEGANLRVWLAGRMFFDQKFMTLFSMLFGAGIVLMAGRAEARGDAGRVHYRRMGWLLVIGLLHAHLLWHGDIPVHLRGVRHGRVSVAPPVAGAAAGPRDGPARGRLGPVPRFGTVAAVLAGRRTGGARGRGVAAGTGGDRRRARRLPRKLARAAARPLRLRLRAPDVRPAHVGLLARRRADARRDGPVQGRGLQRGAFAALLRRAGRRRRSRPACPCRRTASPSTSRAGGRSGRSSSACSSTTGRASRSASATWGW